jgi:hypothetical protein
MKQETAGAILTMLSADQTVEFDHREAIKAAIVKPPEHVKRRDLIDGTEAARIMGCCKRTVFRMATIGRINRIMLSERRVRFDRNEIIDFRNRGITAE